LYRPLPGWRKVIHIQHLVQMLLALIFAPMKLRNNRYVFMGALFKGKKSFLKEKKLHRLPLFHSAKV
jgi:hypothetical protein